MVDLYLLNLTSSIYSWKSAASDGNVAFYTKEYVP
jgi:hypothetical protein